VETEIAARQTRAVLSEKVLQLSPCGDSAERDCSHSELCWFLYCSR
jgi:hypothetical protein